MASLQRHTQSLLIQPVGRESCRIKETCRVEKAAEGSGAVGMEGIVGERDQ